MTFVPTCRFAHLDDRILKEVVTRPPEKTLKLTLLPDFNRK